MTFTAEEAQAFVERAETMDPAEVEWSELDAAIAVLRSIAHPWVDRTHPWVDRIMAIVARKAAAAIEAVRSGTATTEDEGEVNRAVQVAQESHRTGTARAASAQAFLSEVADARRDIELVTREPRVAGPRGGRGTEAAETGRTERRRDVAATQRRQIDLTNAVIELGAQAGISDTMLQQALSEFTDRVQFAGEDPAAVIAEFRQRWLGEAIGVPPGFMATRHDPTTDATGGLERWRQRTGRETPTRPSEVAPRFFEGDQFSPSALPTEERAELQAAMVEAGLLEDGTFWVGEWDAKSMEAYYTVLTYANTWGTSPEETLTRLAASLPAELRAGAAGAGEAVFTPPAYLAPDYASLAQSVKAMFRGRVGRDPSEAELSELAGAMGGFYRAQFDAQVAASRAEFEAGQQGAETGETVIPAAGTAVDPAARFAELFEQRFKPEIDRLGSLADVQANERSVFESLRTMQTLIGG